MESSRIYAVLQMYRCKLIDVYEGLKFPFFYQNVKDYLIIIFVIAELKLYFSLITNLVVFKQVCQKNE